MDIQYASQPSYGTLEKKLRWTLSQLSVLFKDIRRHSDQERPETWQRFRSFSYSEQEACLRNATLYLEICQETLTGPEPAPLTNDNKLIWYALKKLSLVPTGDLFDLLDDSYVVEIYNPQGIQVFRNYRFFEISSYNFAELFIYPWHELYQRDQSIDEQIACYGQKLFSGAYKSTVNVRDIPQHYIDEKFSPEKFSMQMQQKFFAPLKSKLSNDIYAAAVSDVEVLPKQYTKTHEATI